MAEFDERDEMPEGLDPASLDPEALADFPGAEAVNEDLVRERQAAQTQAADARREDLARQVLRVIREHPITSGPSLREYVPRRREDVYSALAWLLDQGRVRRESPRGRYLVTPAGEEWLS